MTAVAPSKIFSAIDEQNLRKIASQEHIEDKKRKDEIIAQITNIIEDFGLSQITNELSLVQLQQVCEPLDLDFTDVNPNSKVVLRKRLHQKVNDQIGLKKFLKEYMDEEKLAHFVRAVGEEPVSDDMNDLVKQVKSIINLVGTSTFLSRYDTPFLKEIMQKLKLKCQTDSKDKIVHAIVTKTAATTEKKETKIVFSKSKKSIKQGVTYQDIFQHYFLEELLEYCEKKGLKKSGTKPEVIKRILAFLDGDTENTMATNTADKKKSVEKTEKVEKKKAVAKETVVEKETSSNKSSSKKEKESPASKKSTTSPQIKKSAPEPKKKSNLKVEEKPVEEEEEAAEDDDDEEAEEEEEDN